MYNKRKDVWGDLCTIKGNFYHKNNSELFIVLLFKELFLVTKTPTIFLL